MASRCPTRMPCKTCSKCGHHNSKCTDKPKEQKAIFVEKDDTAENIRDSFFQLMPSDDGYMCVKDHSKCEHNSSKDGKSSASCFS